MPNNKLSLLDSIVTGLVDPILHVFGLIIALYLVYKYYKWRTKVKAPVWAWEKYINVLIAEDEFEEVIKIQKLLKDKGYYDEIPTPKGFKVRKREKLDLEDRFEEMTFVLNKSYEFTRTADKGSKGFEVKMEKNNK